MGKNIVSSNPLPFNLTPAQVRNRDLLMKALRNGMAVTETCPDRDYEVTSQSRPGLIHTVLLDTRDGAAWEACPCEWGRQLGDQGWIARAANSKPCSHVLAVRFYNMPEDTRTALLAIDTDLAAVAPPARYQVETVEF